MTPTRCIVCRGADTFWAEEALVAAFQHTRTASKPSDWKITDLRVAALPNRPLVRLDTNPGISGYGEVRDGASKTYALMLKRLLPGENPSRRRQSLPQD